MYHKCEKLKEFHKVFSSDLKIEQIGVITTDSGDSYDINYCPFCGERLEN